MSIRRQKTPPDKSASWTLAIRGELGLPRLLLLLAYRLGPDRFRYFVVYRAGRRNVRTVIFIKQVAAISSEKVFSKGGFQRAA